MDVSEWNFIAGKIERSHHCIGPQGSLSHYILYAVDVSVLTPSGLVETLYFFMVI